MSPTLEHIWDEFSEKLGRFIRLRVSEPAEAEDILQDVFVKIQERLGQLHDTAKLQSWVYLIARNAVIDHYRTRKPTVPVPESLIAEAAESDPEIESLTMAFRRMIYALPEPYRDALVLTELEGLSQKQLAERLGISLSGAKSRVQRARQQLKELLHACCTFEFDRRGRVTGCSPKPDGGCNECS